METTETRRATREVAWTVHGQRFRLEASRTSGRPTFELFRDDDPAIRLTGAELRALNAAFALLGAIEDAAQKPLAPRAGRPWTPEDDEQLTRRFLEGEPVGALAKAFERSRGSIEARLVRLGLAEGPEGRWGALRRGVTAHPDG